MFKNRKRNRMAGYDYSQNALYFITICVKDRICCFGKVVNGQMECNEYGDIAHLQWQWLFSQYPYIVSHAFVVMPNHVHGVIEIDDSRVVGAGRDLSVRDLSVLSERVGAGRDLPLQSIKIKPLSQLIGAYKTTSSAKIHLAGMPDFNWQRSFHDHIIRDEKAYLNIVDYIKNNPKKWAEDCFCK
jgi:REP element-mobilizing transposase RayT